MRSKKAKSNPVGNSHVVPRKQHPISKTNISPNALKVLNRLNEAGYQAYLVGGSVRDLLLGKAPKDFDVATNATPNQVRNLFRNGRIIGRRFKLVHILFHREIIEVATFRGSADAHEDQKVHEETGMVIRDNVFGTIEEDAWRRDFTINSLYYHGQESSILDFTGGVHDIHKRLIRIIGDPVMRYQEDPVRMLRAIRFSAKLQFEIAKDTAEPMKTSSALILNVSGSRLFEEMTKLYQCGEAETAHKMLVEYGLFAYLFEQTYSLFNSQYPVKSLLSIALQNTDTRIRENKPVTPAFLFSVLLWFPMLQLAETLRAEGMDHLPALEKAMSIVIATQNRIVTVPKRFTQVVREIWIMQFRFPKRQGKRAYGVLSHPRFRAAYDFLAIRALAGDESMELADWWTKFQEVDEALQERLIAAVSTDEAPKKKRHRKPKPKGTNVEKE